MYLKRRTIVVACNRKWDDVGKVKEDGYRWKLALC